MIKALKFIGRIVQSEDGEGSRSRFGRPVPRADAGRGVSATLWTVTVRGVSVSCRVCGTMGGWSVVRLETFTVR